MFNFRNLFLETSTISCIIWIQLFLFIFLFFILYSAIASDSPYDSSTATAPESAIVFQHSLSNRRSSSTLVTNPLQNVLGVERPSINVQIARSSSTRIVREEIVAEVSPLHFLHPYFYFRLARGAFLKCLGLDSTSEYDVPSTQNHIKRKEI